MKKKAAPKDAAKFREETSKKAAHEGAPRGIYCAAPFPTQGVSPQKAPAIAAK
jgi:hypothetical protein